MALKSHHNIFGPYSAIYIYTMILWNLFKSTSKMLGPGYKIKYHNLFFPNRPILSRRVKAIIRTRRTVWWIQKMASLYLNAVLQPGKDNMTCHHHITISHRKLSHDFLSAAKFLKFSLFHMDCNNSWTQNVTATFGGYVLYYTTWWIQMAIPQILWVLFT